MILGNIQILKWTYTIDFRYILLLFRFLYFYVLLHSKTHAIELSNQHNIANSIFIGQVVQLIYRHSFCQHLSLSLTLTSPRLWLSILIRIGIGIFSYFLCLPLYCNQMKISSASLHVRWNSKLWYTIFFISISYNNYLEDNIHTTYSYNIWIKIVGIIGFNKM